MESQVMKLISSSADQLLGFATGIHSEKNSSVFAYEALTDFQKKYSEYFLQRIHPAWIEKLLDENGHLNCSTLPMLETCYRFSKISWKILPYLCWEKIERIESQLQRAPISSSLGHCYYPEWSKLSKDQQQRCCDWIYYKLNPETAELFLHDLTSQKHETVQEIEESLCSVDLESILKEC